MTQDTAKLCALCHKDVSAEKHIKDKKGRYYCTPCYTAAIERQRTAQTAAAPAAAPGATPAPAKSDDDLYDVKDEPTPAKPRTAPPPAAKPSAAPAAPAKLPEFCPACGAKMLAGRKICIKCNRDVTKLDNLLAMRAKQQAEAQAEQSSKSEAFATWFGKFAKVGVWAVGIGVVVLIIWGVYMMFFPGDLWEGFPKTREAAVREFLTEVAKGTDKGYHNAFMLISYRERTTGNAEDERKYTLVFRRMHDEFEKKHGKDWIKNYKLELEGIDDLYPDDDVIFLLTIGKDKYHISTQVQMDTTTATAKMFERRATKAEYPENGENRFGVIDVHEYRVSAQRRMAKDITGGGPRDKPDPPGLIPPE